MTNARFKITFEGDPFGDGEIYVHELVSFLPKFDEVVQAATMALSEATATAHLKVVATKKGSFDLSLMIVVMDLVIKAGTIADALVGLFIAYKNRKVRSDENVKNLEEGINQIPPETEPQTSIVNSNVTILLNDPETIKAFGELITIAADITGLQSLCINYDGKSVTLSHKVLQSSEEPDVLGPSV